MSAIQRTTMASNKFILFSESFEGFIDLGVERIMEVFLRDLNVPDNLRLPRREEYTLEWATDMLFKATFHYYFELRNKERHTPNPEESVAELIRMGLPKENVSATYSFVNVFLPNGKYRLYRAISGVTEGTIRVARNMCCTDFVTDYTPKEVAEFIMLVDPLLPKIDEAARKLFQEMEEAVRQKQIDEKVREIAKKTVETQLKAVLPGLGVSCSYKIEGDKVHLDLSRVLQAGIDIPLSELADLLADPGKIESALKPSPDNRIVEDRPETLPPYFPRHNLQRSIIFEPDVIY